MSLQLGVSEKQQIKALLDEYNKGNLKDLDFSDASVMNLDKEKAKINYAALVEAHGQRAYAESEAKPQRDTFRTSSKKSIAPAMDYLLMAKRKSLHQSICRLLKQYAPNLVYLFPSSYATLRFSPKRIPSLP